MVVVVKGMSIGPNIAMKAKNATMITPVLAILLAQTCLMKSFVLITVSLRLRASVSLYLLVITVTPYSLILGSIKPYRTSVRKFASIIATADMKKQPCSIG